ncbi:unnamed protein product [Rotaria socialis]|uniref:Alpha/beta hydrolase fold-3 domain-containing protein n=1 Tax=Rotaria socialis TaxID=392032 RepID=A0A820KEK3_9BILA|nr:unnamed protein product [Rotaria socialis]CAF3266252.1 unnamed protein product [Rotaria socialis]CAF3398917.1 unnamed protein product [Rotaria socialis]CAF3778869.1 unnamed protein product [Rotaria socialis]CAF3782636.1 unnamed protein product [Rotaria socialis]
MARKLQLLAIITSILIGIFAYLYHVPNSEGVPQMDRIRLLSASMKIISFVGLVSETFGFAPAWYVQRNSGVILKKLKPTEVNVNLKIEDTTIDGVPVRIYSPLDLKDDKAKLFPAIIFFHGGAFYMGSIETHHSVTRELALQTRFIVISVGYRLAPEHPFPAGLDDCIKVTQYVLDTNSAEKLNIDSKRVAISGDSAGGNLAAVTAMRFANNSNTPRLQMLIYPVLQFFDFMVPSYLTPALHIFHFGRGGLVLELYINKSISEDIILNNHTSIEQKNQYRRFVDWSLIPNEYRQIYKKPITDNIDGNPKLIENAKQVLHPDLSPLLVENEELSKLPSTYILTVDHDRLRDESFIYAARLKTNGVDVVHRHYENTFHGSLTFLDGLFELDIAHRMLNDIVEYLKEKL